MKQRPGFTLIETVFAIFVFSIGALGFAATSAVVLRSLAESAARERAARIASSRIEIIRSLACGEAQSGSESRGGMTAAWTVSATGAGLAAAVTVNYISGRSPRADSYQSLLACVP